MLLLFLDGSSMEEEEEDFGVVMDELILFNLVECSFFLPVPFITFSSSSTLLPLTFTSFEEEGQLIDNDRDFVALVSLLSSDKSWS